MFLKKVGALVITILVFVLVACVPHLLGCVMEPGVPETATEVVERWFLGFGAMLLSTGAILFVGALFCVVYILVLDVLD